MKFLDSRVYRVACGFSDFVILNLLWLLVSLPVVTLYPATAAMFSVCRERLQGGNLPSVIESFFSAFKRDFGRSIRAGFVWTLIGGILTLNYGFLFANYPTIEQMPLVLQFPLYLWVVCTALAYAFSSIYLFPVMVNYKTTWKQVLKDSFLLSIGRPLTSTLCLLLVALSVVALLIFPISLLVLGSVASYTIYWLCARTF